MGPTVLTPSWIGLRQAAGRAVLENVQLASVVDGKTIKVVFPEELCDSIEQEHKLGSPKHVDIRLKFVDTEECQVPRGASRFYKPVTYLGAEAAAWLKKYFGAEHDGRVVGDVRVDLEFEDFSRGRGGGDRAQPGGEPDLRRCLQTSHEAYGRLLAVVRVRHADEGEDASSDANANVAVVRQGLSPYFVKYGKSVHHHEAFLEAERLAVADMHGIWSPFHSGVLPSCPPTGLLTAYADYRRLLPWWHMRASILDDFRRAECDETCLCVRHDYTALQAAAAGDRGERVTVLCDLQSQDPTLEAGVLRDVFGSPPHPGADRTHRGARLGAVVYAGSRKQPFNLWIEASPEEELKIRRLILNRYAEGGRSYVFVTGWVFMYRSKRRPQMVISTSSQFSDSPPHLGISKASTCNLCKNPIESPADLTQMDCGHTFHTHPCLRVLGGAEAATGVLASCPECAKAA